MSYLQNQPIAARRGILFSCRNAAGVPQTGLAFAGADLQVVRATDVAWANAANSATVVEVGGGDYFYFFSQAELSIVGALGFKMAKAGSIQMDYQDVVEQAFFTTAQAGSLSATAFTCDRAEATAGFWTNAKITALTGNLTGQVKTVGGYTTGPSTIQILAGQSFTQAPLAGDVFMLIVK